MAHCPCFGGKKGRRKLKKEKEKEKAKDFKPAKASNARVMSSVQVNAKFEPTLEKSVSKDDSHSIEAPLFSYRELATATNNFRIESLIGEGGFGPVYKGELESTGQIVAVKKLNHSGLQGDKEFLVEVLMLSLARHPNLVNLVGYCAEGEQRLLVYEFMPLGSLESHLHDLRPDMEPLDWNTRMTIAAGAAKGLNYLHNEAVPPVIYRDLKSSNILLDEGFNPKLSDFGLAKFGPSTDKSHVSTRVMGTHGYCAPEYAGTGKLTVKSDIYSFGIVLLELITGRKALDATRVYGKQPLVDWVRPLLRDRRNIGQLADRRLRGQFTERSLRKAIELALMCIRDDAQSRPDISEVVVALNYLASQKYDPTTAHANRQEHGKDQITPEGEERKTRSMMEDTGSGSASEESTPLSKERERERAVAEAKMWGESWREKRRQTTQSEFDNTNW